MKEETKPVSREHHPTQEIEGEKVYRWVKASERLPEIEKPVHLRFRGIIGVGENVGNSIVDDHKGTLDDHEVEWLEEIPLSTHTSEGKISEKPTVDEVIAEYNAMSKDEIWKKWQSDKKFLSKCMTALTKLGVKTLNDLENVSEGKREAIELDGNDVMSVIEFYRTNQNIYFNTQNKKVYENNAEITLGRLRQLYNIYLEIKSKREG